MKPSIELIRLLAVILITFTHTRNELESGALYFIIEKLPTYGTAILSIISGFLYYTVSRKNKNLFYKKIKSLAIPYLIANVSVLIMVLIFNYFFGYNALNRLTYDSSLILEGLFSLNTPPINPPTYFIRDIFIIFSIIALFSQKQYKPLFFLAPLVFFGTLILRFDVPVLFLVGVLFALIKENINKNYVIMTTSIITILICYFWPEYLKYPLSFLVFIITLDLKFKFFNTGRYSYLLHLYHSPIMVISFPLLSLLTDHYLIIIFGQILITILCVYLLFAFTKKYDALKILSVGR